MGARHQDAPGPAWDLHIPPKQTAGQEANVDFGSTTSRRHSSQHDTGISGDAENIGRVNARTHRKQTPSLEMIQRLLFLFTIKRDQEVSLPWYTSTFEEQNVVTTEFNLAEKGRAAVDDIR